MQAFLGLDIGTTSTAGILIDAAGKTLANAERPSQLTSRHANWAEEDPELWWSNCRELCRDPVKAGGIAAGDIAAVGVTGMVPAVVLLDRDGKLFRPDPMRTRVFDRAYANFRETYERLKTLYPKLDLAVAPENLATRGDAA
jgi:sugar (pentulose or hexulose) kinase